MSEEVPTVALDQIIDPTWGNKVAAALQPGGIAERLFNAVFWQWRGESIDGFTTTLSGGASAVVQNNSNGLSLTSENVANAETMVTALLNQSTVGVLYFNKRMMFEALMQLHSTITTRNDMYCVTSYGTTIATQTEPHFGFIVENGQVKGSCADGTTQSKTANLQTLVAEGIYALKAIFYPGQVDFYIDGVLKGSLTTNLPLATDSVGQMMAFMTAPTVNLTRDGYLWHWKFMHSGE